MSIAAMRVPDAWVSTPRVFGDDRGVFLEWLRADALAAASGREFTVRQANHSVSTRGTLRGVHFADVPPGQAKYVYCPSGAVLDVVVDLRVDSPTFGEHDSVVLDAVDRRAVFVSEGLGHAFCALTDDANVTYLVSSTYDPGAEHGIHPLDPDLALPWPDDLGELTLSGKDREAPGLLAARDAGLLPTMAGCRQRYSQLAAALDG